MSAQTFLGSAYAPGPLVIDKAAATTTDLIAAVADKKVRAYSLRLSAAGAVIVSILDGATVLERFNFGAAGDRFNLDLRELPYYTTTAGNALRITLSAAVQVDGVIEFTQGV